MKPLKPRRSRAWTLRAGFAHGTGKYEGDEVVQVYIRDELASVARPLKELVAFKRVGLKPGESKDIELEVPYRRFGMWDRDMTYRVEEGWFAVWLGHNAEEMFAGNTTIAAVITNAAFLNSTSSDISA